MSNLSEVSPAHRGMAKLVAAVEAALEYYHCVLPSASDPIQLSKRTVEGVKQKMSMVSRIPIEDVVLFCLITTCFLLC